MLFSIILLLFGGKGLAALSCQGVEQGVFRILQFGVLGVREGVVGFGLTALEC